jgi:hypothetical protein
MWRLDLAEALEEVRAGDGRPGVREERARGVEAAGAFIGCLEPIIASRRGGTCWWSGARMKVEVLRSGKASLLTSLHSKQYRQSTTLHVLPTTTLGIARA